VVLSYALEPLLWRFIGSNKDRLDRFYGRFKISTIEIFFQLSAILQRLKIKGLAVTC